MDPQYHDTIVDKLMQYRGKIPPINSIQMDMSRQQAKDVQLMIDILIKNIDILALFDEKGYLG